MPSPCHQGNSWNRGRPLRMILQWRRFRHGFVHSIMRQLHTSYRTFHAHTSPSVTPRQDARSVHSNPCSPPGTRHCAAASPRFRIPVIEIPQHRPQATFRTGGLAPPVDDAQKGPSASDLRLLATIRLQRPRPTTGAAFSYAVSSTMSLKPKAIIVLCLEQ